MRAVRRDLRKLDRHFISPVSYFVFVSIFIGRLKHGN